MKTYALYLPEWSAERWAWLLDFALAGLSFEHSFDLLIGESVQTWLAAGSPDALRTNKQIAALQHHGLGQLLVRTEQAPQADYAHVFRF